MRGRRSESVKIFQILLKLNSDQLNIESCEFKTFQVSLVVTIRGNPVVIT